MVTRQANGIKKRKGVTHLIRLCKDDTVKIADVKLCTHPLCEEILQEHTKLVQVLTRRLIGGSSARSALVCLSTCLWLMGQLLASVTVVEEKILSNVFVPVFE